MTRSHHTASRCVCGYVQGIGGLSRPCFLDGKHLCGAFIVALHVKHMNDGCGAIWGMGWDGFHFTLIERKYVASALLQYSIGRIGSQLMI